MKKIFLVAALLAVSASLSAQNFKYTWKRVFMDKTYESENILEVDKIVAAHQKDMTSLMEVLIYSDAEIVSRRPESALSNLAADVLYYTAQDYKDENIPMMSLTNFGGIRNNFPQGSVRLYDVLATFPFDNSLVLAKVKGSEIRKILEGFARRDKFEALGGIQMTVKNGKLKECLIEGKPLKDKKMYYIATIDFLLDGGDRFHIGKDAVSVKRTGIMLRDAVEAYLRKLSTESKVLTNEKDGRIKFE